MIRSVAARLGSLATPTRLAELSPHKARLLEQRYFGGLKLEECAEVLGVSLATVTNDLRLGRAWLARQPPRTPG